MVIFLAGSLALTAFPRWFGNGWVEDLASGGLESEQGWDGMRLTLEWNEDDSAVPAKERWITSWPKGERYLIIKCSALFDDLPENGLVGGVELQGMLEADGEHVWTYGGDDWFGFWDNPPIPVELSDYQDVFLSKSDDSQSVSAKTTRESEDSARTFSRKLRIAHAPFSKLQNWKGKKVSYRGKARVQVTDIVQLAGVPFGEDFVVERKGINLKVTGGKGEWGEGDIILTARDSGWNNFPSQNRISQGGELQLFLVNEKRREFLLETATWSTFWDGRVMSRETELHLSDYETVFSIEG